MLRKIIFIVFFIFLFLNISLIKADNIIENDVEKIINFKNLSEKTRDLIKNKSLVFEVNTGTIVCNEETCNINTAGIYSGNIKLNTKLDNKILKTDYYTIDKTRQIVNNISFSKNRIIKKDNEVIYSYANLTEKEKDFIKNGDINISSNKGQIICKNEVCFIKTDNVYSGNINIKIKSKQKILKEYIFKIAKFSENLDISSKFKYKSIQKYDLSCEISATSDIISAILSKKITEDELIEKLDKTSFYGKKAISYKGQRLWGNPEEGFVGAIDNARQSEYTGYGVLEKPIQKLYYKYSILSSSISSKNYTKDFGQKEHLRDLLIELNKGNFVQLWGDYLTNPNYEDGKKAGKISQEEANRGLSATNYSKTRNVNRKITWNYMKDGVLYEHIGLNGEHAFYLLGYEGPVDNPVKIIVWDTKTGKHKYPISEWFRKWNLMQNRSLIINGY